MKNRFSALCRAAILALCISTVSAAAVYADEAVGSSPVSETLTGGEEELEAAEAKGEVPVLVIEEPKQETAAAETAADGAETKETAAGTAAEGTEEQEQTAVKPADDNSTAQEPPKDTYSAYTVDAPLSDADLEEDEKHAEAMDASVKQLQGKNTGITDPFVSGSTDTASELTTDWSQVSEQRMKIVDCAKSLVGGTYTYGGTSPDTGLDCSGLVMYVMKAAADIDLYHQSAVQATKGVGVTAEEMRPGDIIAYDGRPRNGTVNHIGVYIGDGQMVHAVGTGKGIRISAWNFEDPITIRNVLGD